MKFYMKKKCFESPIYVEMTTSSKNIRQIHFFLPFPTYVKVNSTVSNKV